MTNLQTYLLGNNKNLVGTIIGFKKGWRKIDLDSFDHYAVFLYVSHETGRIERFLYNSGSKTGQYLSQDIVEDYNEVDFEEKNINDFDERMSLIEERRSQVNIFLDPLRKEVKMERATIENYLNKDYINELLGNIKISQLDFKTLTKGKLNKHMYTLFLVELVRDYFIYHSSFKICDMDILRNYTTFKDKINVEESELYPLGHRFNYGTGGTIDWRKLQIDLTEYYRVRYNLDILESRIVVRKSTEQFYNRLSEFKADRFIDQTENNVRIINIPKNFDSKSALKNFYESYTNYEFIASDKNNNPQLIKDLKSFINSRTIMNRGDLICKVMQWNEMVYKKLKKMS